MNCCKIILTCFFVFWGLIGKGYPQGLEKQLRVTGGLMYQKNSSKNYSDIGPALGFEYDVFGKKGIFHTKIQYHYLNINGIKNRVFHEYIGNTLKLHLNYLFPLKFKSRSIFIGPGIAFHQTLSPAQDNGPDYGLVARVFIPSLALKDRMNLFYDFDWIAAQAVYRHTLGVSFTVFHNH